METGHGLSTEEEGRGDWSKDRFSSESSYINNIKNYFFNSLFPEPAHLGRALIRPGGNVFAPEKGKGLG